MWVRAATVDDLDALVQLQREASLLAFAHVFPPERYPYPSDAIRGRWRGWLESAPSDVLVAVERSAIVGVVKVEGTTLRSLFVTPNLWGRGIGRRLHDLAVSRIESTGSSTATLQVLAENDRARRLYERAGWYPTGRTEPSPFPPNPVLMEYQLALEEDRGARLSASGP